MRVAMIGCGAIAQHGHLPAIKSLHGMELAAVVDTDAAWAQQVARRHGARFAATDYRDVAGRVDVAIVATPNATHVEIASFLLRHGVHVLCEKPLAPSASEACELYALAERAGARLMAGHSRRFTDGALALRRLVALGALGRIEHLWAALGMPLEQWPAREAFRASASLAGGGCLVDSGIHLIDLALWLVGEEACVEAFQARRGAETDLEVDAQLGLRFQNGAHARLACSYSHALTGILEVHGSEGWARLPIDGSPGMEFSARGAVAGRASGVQRVPVSGVSPYLRQLSHFADAIHSGKPFVVQPREVATGLRLIEECYACAA